MPEYWIGCPNCGRYKVSENYFNLFLPLGKKEEIARRIEQGAVGAVLKFEEKCPKCTRRGYALGEVIVLWTKEGASNGRLQ